MKLILAFLTAALLLLSTSARAVGRESGGSSPFSSDIDAIIAIRADPLIWRSYFGEIVSIERVSAAGATKTFRFATNELVPRKNEHGSTVAWDPVLTSFEVDVAWVESMPSPGAGKYSVSEVRSAAVSSCEAVFRFSK